MIIETTKQDEIDEVKFRSKQEIDSLNHIIGKNNFNYRNFFFKSFLLIQ